jgi:para-nitrobenzyl esterase
MRRHFHRLIVFFLICIIARALALPVASPPSVTLESGALEGTQFGSAPNEVAFLGVPYAAPPIGDLRWKPPQPARHWTGTHKATEVGAPCPQLPARWLPYIGWNEDCLYLNVWTTQFSTRAKLPVIVYFHGGSNTSGYSQMDPLGPTLSRLGVVVVSTNYRLGPLGFLAHPALTAESEHHSSGNYGLLDQLQALEWVRDNISHFGGDPSRVTVMGQSAGAVDVCLLMASPLAAGLFQRAIMESGDCQSTLNKDIRKPIPYNSISGSGEQSGERLANELGVADGPKALQKLRSIPPDEILKSWSHHREIHFDAIVDGWVVPEQPSRIYAEGKQAKVAVLIGSNADEATVFGHNDVKTIDEYKSYLREDVGRYADQEFEAYPAPSDADVARQYLQLQNDSFAYGAYSMAQAMTKAREGAYLYLFTYAETGTRAHLGAYHGEELKFLSDSFPNDWEHSPAESNLGEAIRRYWTQFARTGNPNSRGLPNWPAFNLRTDERFEIGRAMRVQPVPTQLHLLKHIEQEVSAETGDAPRQLESN